MKYRFGRFQWIIYPSGSVLVYNPRTNVTREFSNIGHALVMARRTKRGEVGFFA